MKQSTTVINTRYPCKIISRTSLCYPKKVVRYCGCKCSCAGMLDDHGSKELKFGFKFHLGAFQRIVVTSERVPFDAIGVRGM